ncbi:hypothetical protein Btru_010481 [Bulinus truncatus]|nr:hypothetical protein Btru_010481 [Bulinus truncatus]
MGVTNVGLSGMALSNVCLSGMAVTNVGLSGMGVTNVGLSGMAVSNVGIQGMSGVEVRMKPGYSRPQCTECTDQDTVDSSVLSAQIRIQYTPVY